MVFVADRKRMRIKWMRTFHAYPGHAIVGKKNLPKKFGGEDSRTPVRLTCHETTVHSPYRCPRPWLVLCRRAEKGNGTSQTLSRKENGNDYPRRRLFLVHRSHPAARQRRRIGRQRLFERPRQKPHVSPGLRRGHRPRRGCPGDVRPR